MGNKINPAELNARLLELNKNLEGKGTPLRFRPLECFKAIHGPLPDGPVRRQLFDSIIDWFTEHYGESAAWDGVVGRIPVILRGQLYLVRVPFAETQTIVKFTDQIENLPKSIAESFTFEEFEQLGRKVNAGSEAFFKLYNLHVDDHVLAPAQRPLVRRALFDFEHTATSLRHTGDTQNAIFHTHEAAEKFLKVALQRCGGPAPPKRLGHDLRKIFSILVHRQSRFDWLKSSVDALQDAAPTMEIRYSDVPRTIEHAVTCFNAALSICGTLAGIWLLDSARGSSKGEFVVGRFYVDTAGRTYRCKELRSDGCVCLRHFTHNPAGVIVGDMTIKAAYASLYLEVSAASDVKALCEKYDFCVLHANRPVTCEELRVKIATGAEGSYVSAIRTIEIDPQSNKEQR